MNLNLVEADEECAGPALDWEHRLPLAMQKLLTL
jgi:hypothetical protein